MKKFLTVLLALSVVFTYTVGTAFALPSDETTEAGLASAKAAAINELNGYLDLSNYDSSAQAKIKVIINDYTDKINDAESVNDYDTYSVVANPVGDPSASSYYELVGGVYTASTDKAVDSKKTYYTKDAAKAKGVQTLLKDGKAELDAIKQAASATLADAKKAAKAQFNDYVYLIDNAKALNLTIADDAVKDAKVGYSTYAAFKTAAGNAIEAATDVKGVEKALDTFLKKADKIYAQLQEVEVPQTEIDALVAKIRSEAAANKVSNVTHSDAVVAQYEAAIEKGVAAAKAVKTWDEYFKVKDMYLGVADSKAADNDMRLDGITAVAGVYVHVKQLSVFEQYKNKTKNVEKQIKAVEKVMAALGDYDYKNVAAANWADAEKFYAQAKYFIENGAFEGNTAVAAGALAELYDISTAVTAASTTNQVNAAVEAIVAEYLKYTPLGVLKASLVTDINDYKGKTLQGAAVAAMNEYEAANETAIEALRATAENLINAAKSEKDAQAVYDQYAAKIDAIDTKAETEFKASVKAYNKVIDEYVAANTDKNLTDDQKVLVDRFVADLKQAYLDGETKATITNDDASAGALKIGTGTSTLENVLAGITYAGAVAVGDATGAKAGYTVAVTAGAYYTKNEGIANAIVAGYEAAIKDGAEKTVDSWAKFFKTHDAAVKELDAVQTKVQADYIAAIEDAETAIAALGTPALTTAFKAALDKADAAITAYNTAKGEFEKLDADEQAEVTKTLDTSVYDSKKFEYDRLAYVDGLGSTAADPIAEVEAFTAIANDFLTMVKGNFSSAQKAEIAQIVNDTYAAISAAATDAAKAEAAKAGIEKLDAIPVYTAASDQDLADLLAAVKGEAAKYFNKYEKAAFTSEATTKLALVKDIIAFNAKFYAQEDKDYNEYLKLGVKGTHIKIYSKAYKKYTKISWKKELGFKVDGYEVYRATKRNGKFTKIWTAKSSSKSVNNTKNRKKGTTYFYKLRGFRTIGGEKVYTHWSITVARKAR